MEQRSQRRVHSAIPVQIQGVDAKGESFEESTEAVEVSRRGLSVLTRRDLPVYTSLTVVIPGRGPSRSGERQTDFFANATVVGAHKEGESYRVSIRFIGATLPIYTAETT